MTQVLAPTGLRRWLPYGLPAADIRLFCLPHAGGSASTYRPWCGKIAGVAVCPIQLPGRETRLRETPYTDMASLVSELAEVLLAELPCDDRYAVYGHSLGGLVGFELLREIRRRGGPDPVHLFVSGCPAPDHPNRDEPVSGMDDARVVALLRRLGGTPDWVLSDPTALRMILPPFRADFAVKDGYVYQPGPPLSTPITAIAATADPRADAASMAGWRYLTTGEFRLHTMAGGHFAMLERATVTLRHIEAALRGRRTQGSGQ